MSSKTISESVFERFCTSNELEFERIVEGNDPTPDYLVTLNGLVVYVEVKQIDEDTDFSTTRQLRVPGTHIRAKINQARNQVRHAAASGAPGILLVYNNLDPLQRFGTEPHDFLAAMYGDLTLIASREAKRITGPFFGRNQSFREGKNDSFSAVGWLHSESNWVSVHLYENMYAKVSLDYASLPAFISYKRTQEQGE